MHHCARKKCIKLRKRILLTIVLALFFMLVGCFYSFYYSKNHLAINAFSLSTSKVTSPLRLAILADLHDHEFGKNNCELVDEVIEEDPDLVLLVGDFVNEDSENADIPCAFIKNLVEKLPADVPVYFALGNHELAYMEQQPQPAGQVGESLIVQIEEAGAVVLDKEFVDFEMNGQQIRLGGMYDYAFGTNGDDEAEAAPADVKAFLEEFQDTDALKIMMAHRPDSFIFGDAAEYWDVDLVVSGHVHGGQVVLPFVGGVYGMDQGWFPEYDHGLYELGDMQLFLTSGLGSCVELVPRINNPPEIAVLELEPKHFQ